MHPILKSIRLDHDILKVYYRSFILAAYGIAILIPTLTKIPGLAIVIVMVISAPFVGLNFLLYEKNNLSKLYGILPLGKNEVVIGRYLYALAFGIANSVAATLLAAVLSWAVNARMSPSDFLTWIFASFAYFCVYVAVQFPIYFGFTFSKVYLWTNLPIYLLVLVYDYLVRKEGLLLQLQPVIQYFTAHPNLIWATGIGLELLLLVISIPLSCLIHRRSEL